MNTNERNEMVKPEELNIMPEAVQTEVTDVNPIEETETEVVEEINALADLEIGVEDDDENEETETEYDFSTLNKLQLIEILEETVQDTDVVKIKDKVVEDESLEELESFIVEEKDILVLEVEEDIKSENYLISEIITDDIEQELIEEQKEVESEVDTNE